MMEIVNYIFNLLNTNFSAALLGALTGAFIGHYVSDRAKKREDAITLLRSINVAKSLAYNICNQLLAYKAHQLSNNLENFEQLKSIYERGEDQNVHDQIYEAMNLPIFSTPQICLEEFKNIVLKDISPTPRAISCIYIITDCYEELKITIERREEFIKNLQTRIEANDKDILNLIFGTPTKSGNRNQLFSHTLEIIAERTDNLIFFSNLILQDLEKLEENMISKNKFYKHQKLDNKSLNNFSESAWLFPDSADYEDWLKLFPDEDKPLQLNKS